MALMQLYKGKATGDTIKVWFKQPKYTDIIREVRLTKNRGYDYLFFTCDLEKDTFFETIQVKQDICIVDQYMAKMKAIEVKRYDLLDDLENGIED